MSRQAFLDLRQKLSDDPEMLKEFTALGVGDPSAVTAEQIVAFGAEHGFAFTVDEMRGDGELTDEQLESVSGGFEMVVGRVAGPELGSLLVNVRDRGF